MRAVDRWIGMGVCLVTALALISGCATQRSGPVPITLGTLCDVCGMEVLSLRFACERQVGDAFRFYDAIECLARDETPGAKWLSDYDRQTLHAADSMWVVKGDIASPMGGGLAAFLDRATAEDVAREVDGTVVRLDDLEKASRAPSGAASAEGSS